MRAVHREEIVDYQTYEETRDQFRRRVMEAKEPRRIHVGDYLTFLFENRETIRYQIQEMMRAERIVKEAEIRHEIETYNELLGSEGELGATLMIEIDDPAVRATKLVAWRDLPKHLYVLLENGERVPMSYDPRQVGDERLSSVQYVKFSTGGATPTAIGCDHPDPELRHETMLTEAQRQALATDLEI
jgi:Protein of unknown function (DUF3501)